jgi:hypothetical protein
MVVFKRESVCDKERGEREREKESVRYEKGV